MHENYFPCKMGPSFHKFKSFGYKKGSLKHLVWSLRLLWQKYQVSFLIKAIKDISTIKSHSVSKQSTLEGRSYSMRYEIQQVNGFRGKRKRESTHMIWSGWHVGYKNDLKAISLVGCSLLEIDQVISKIFSTTPTYFV